MHGAFLLYTYLHMKPVIAVLRGGPSAQYQTSLESGAYVLSHIPEHYEARDVFISKEGDWHVGGFPMKPQQALQHTQGVWNALHGEYGEDGKVQRLLESMGIPYVGSGSVASALSMNKKMSKKVYAEYDIPTPMHLVVEYGDNLEDKAKHIFFNFHMPVVIKPATSGGSHGVAIATTRAEIVPYLRAALEISRTVLVEMFIPGKEVVCVVVEGLRGEEHYVPIPIELRYPEKRDIYHADLKRDHSILHRSASYFDESIKNKIADIAKRAHEVLGLRHYSRSDLRVTPTGKIYLLETNSTPVLHPDSVTVQSLRSVGVEPGEFIQHLLARIV
jgi:D-alanine--D-alanine ligase